ncbi:MAG TPA: hypothetical protein VGC87_26505 [Pyrinomonadaceae bacterium]|jgi:hypothetical protein
MMKRGIALGVCLTALLLFGGAQKAAENLSPPAQGQGAWAVSMSRSGGMRPAKQTVGVNSGGQISVYAEHYKAGGAAVVDCSVKVKLADADFLKLKEAVRASRPASWREDYSDEKHPACCDQPTIRLTFSRRESRDSTRVINTSWYPGSSELRPADLAALADMVQELWNKASEHCEASAASR